MPRKLGDLSSYDKATLAFGVLLIILGVASIAVTSQLSYLAAFGVLFTNVLIYHYVTAALVLLSGLVSLAAGITGKPAAYISLIVLSILGILDMIGGIAVIVVFFILNTAISLAAGVSPEYGKTVVLIYVLIGVDCASFVLLITQSSIACCGAGKHATVVHVHHHPGGLALQEGASVRGVSNSLPASEPSYHGGYSARLSIAPTVERPPKESDLYPPVK